MLTQAAEGNGVVFFLGDIQKLSGHEPGQLALDVPAKEAGLNHSASSGPFPPQCYEWLRSI